MMITLMMIASMKRDKRQAVLLGSDAHNITTPRQDRKYHISRKTISSFHTLLQHIVPAGGFKSLRSRYDHVTAAWQLNRK